MTGDEQLVLALIAGRLQEGFERYGALHVQGDPRNWAQEALEEALDQSVYLAALVLRLREMDAAVDAVLAAVPDNINQWQQVGVVCIPMQVITRLQEVRR